MLKIQITYISNIKFSNAKSLLNALYKRNFYLKILFLYNIFLKKKIQKYYINNNINVFSNKLVIIKSPFHYKNSKSLLNFQKQQFNFNIVINNDIKPLFYNNNIIFFFKNLNQFNNFKIKKIKFTHYVKF